MKRTMRAMTLTLCSSFLLFGCADADDAELDETPAEEMVEEPETEVDDDYGFSDWDIDTDRALNRDEWTTWSADYDWSAWNTDAEEGLSEEEFGTTTLTLWDLDDDDRISEDEWMEGTDRWYGDDVDYGVWADWDGNGDSFLDANEVREGFERNNLYDTVDRDADLIIDDEELADWFFDVFDLNDDDEIDTTEWDWGEQENYIG